MALYRIHLSCGGPALLDINAHSLEELGRTMMVNRFICGVLLEEGGTPLAEPISALIPASRIHLVVQA